ncbi:MAG: N-acetyltransferase family protein [Myxococcota bacterium]
MTVRPAREADVPAMLAVYAPFVRDTAVSFEDEVPTVEAFAARVAEVQRTHAWLVLERQGAVAGYAYGAPHRARSGYRWSVETSVYVGPDHQRQGVARALYDALLAGLEAQGFRRALAGITVPNEASVAFHRACGFVDVGVYRAVGRKLGRWHDVLWLQRPLGDPDRPLREPEIPDGRPPGAR